MHLHARRGAGGGSLDGRALFWRDTHTKPLQCLKKIFSDDLIFNEPKIVTSTLRTAHLSYVGIVVVLRPGGNFVQAESVAERDVRESYVHTTRGDERVDLRRITRALNEADACQSQLTSSYFHHSTSKMKLAIIAALVASSSAFTIKVEVPAVSS